MHYIRDNLAVCGYHHIGQREEFESHGFRVQLQCTDNYDPWLAECLEVMVTPFPDGLPIPQELFRTAQDWLAKQWDAGGKILISCAAGQSRSVTMAIALINRKGGLNFLDAAHEVISRVPSAYPHPDVLASAARFSGQALEFAELQSVYAAIRKQPAYPWSFELLQEAALRASSSRLMDSGLALMGSAYFESRLHLPRSERTLGELEWELAQGQLKFAVALDMAQDPGPDGFARYGEWEAELEAEIARRKKSG